MSENLIINFRTKNIHKPQNDFFLSVPAENKERIVKNVFVTVTWEPLKVYLFLFELGRYDTIIDS